MALVLIQQLFVFHTSHAQDGMLIDDLDLVSISDWEEGILTVSGGREQSAQLTLPLPPLASWGCKIAVCQVTSGSDPSIPGAVL